MPKTTLAAQILTAWKQHQRFVWIPRGDIPGRKRDTAVLFRCGSHLTQPQEGIAEEIGRLVSQDPKVSDTSDASDASVQVPYQIKGDFRSAVEVYPASAVPKEYFPWLERSILLRRAIVDMNTEEMARIAGSSDAELKLWLLARLNMALMHLDDFGSAYRILRKYTKENAVVKVPDLSNRLVDNGSEIFFALYDFKLPEEEQVSVAFVKTKIEETKQKYTTDISSLKQSIDSSLQESRAFLGILIPDMLWHLLYNHSQYLSLPFLAEGLPRNDDAACGIRHCWKQRASLQTLESLLSFMVGHIDICKGAEVEEMLRDAKLMNDEEGRGREAHLKREISHLAARLLSKIVIKS